MPFFLLLLHLVIPCLWHKVQPASLFNDSWQRPARRCHAAASTAVVLAHFARPEAQPSAPRYLQSTPIATAALDLTPTLFLTFTILQINSTTAPSVHRLRPERPSPERPSQERPSLERPGQEEKRRSQESDSGWKRIRWTLFTKLFHVLPDFLSLPDFSSFSQATGT
jgi:hypothetical protein